MVEISPKAVARILGVYLCVCLCVAMFLSSDPVSNHVGMMAATYNTLTDSVPLQAGPEEKLLQDPPPQPPTWNVDAFIDALKVKVVLLGTNLHSQNTTNAPSDTPQDTPTWSK